MSFTLNRRRFMQTTSSAIAATALSGISSRASAQSSNELRALVYGGDVGKAIIEAFVKPFEAETGIKVDAITDQLDLNKLELMVTTNSVSVDVSPLFSSSVITAGEKGYLEEIDYSSFRKDDLDAIVGFAKDKYGVGAVIYAYVMAYNTEKYPGGKPRPTSWPEFWDVDKYAGVRTMISGQYGVEGPWEEALLADGVPADALYPLDIDRVFASLDKIKPHIRKWWSTGSEIQQIIVDKAADLMQSYDGRATQAHQQGAPVEINWKNAKLQLDNWVIPKGSPNVKNAQKFIEFVSRADVQAAVTKLYPLGVTNMNAYKSIPDELGRKLASHPEYIKNGIPINAKWYADKGSDGKTNAQRLIDRWNNWILL